MFRSATRPPGDRKAIILLVVVVLLTLFAVIGLSFLLFAENEANVARISREGAGRRELVEERPPVPDDVAGSTIAQILFPEDNPDSVLRGWDLARAVYGWSYDNQPAASYNANPELVHDLAYTGLGRVRQTAPPAVLAVPPASMSFTPPFGDFYLNFMRQQVGTSWVIRDPERSGAPVSPDPHTRDWRVSANKADLNADKQPVGNYVAVNAPYTYPDLKDLYLASIRSSDGKVLVPSYERPWVFGQWTDPLNPTQANPNNGNLTNAYGKFLTLRPRPEDHRYPPGPTGTVEFPYPIRNIHNPADPNDDTEGDVENFDGKFREVSPGNFVAEQQYDSMWKDVGLPVERIGRKRVKPLVAILVTDLDGKLNMNTASNAQETGGTPGSNQGWGGWEANPFYVDKFPNPTYTGTLGGQLASDPPPIPLSAQKLFTEGQIGRYMPKGSPYGGEAASWRTDRPKGKFYSLVDWDASSVVTPPPSVAGPAVVTAPPGGLNAGDPRSAFPTFPDRFDNNSAEGTPHPRHYNPYASAVASSANLLNPQIRNGYFPSSDMVHFLKKFTYPDASQATSSYSQAILGQIYPSAFQGNDAGGGRNRWRNTTLSSDFDRPGYFPWLSAMGTGFTQAAQTADAAGVVQPALQPQGGGVATGVTQTPGTEAPPPSPLYDYQALSFRSRMPGALPGPIDLNRPLPSYKITNMISAAADFQAATEARQKLARDIFVRLSYSVGLGNPDLIEPTGATAQEFAAVRWLAQLAVNVVDQIDEDDVMTPFKWTSKLDATTPDTAQDPRQWVFGTELNRLTITEAYSEYDNGQKVEEDPNFPFSDPVGATPGKYALRYYLNLWVELHNPLTPPGTPPSDPNLPDSDNGKARLFNTQGNFPVYQLDVRTYKSKGLRRADNSLGRADTPDEASASPSTLKQVTVADPAKEGNNEFSVTIGDPSDPLYMSNPRLASLAGGNANLDVVSPSNKQLGEDVINAKGTRNDGFILLGPGPTPADSTDGHPIDPGAAAYQNRFSVPKRTVSGRQEPALRLNVPKSQFEGSMPSGYAIDSAPSVLLKRLACPWLAPQPDPIQPNYNPFVTVDYMQNVPIHDGRKVGGATFVSTIKTERPQKLDTRRGVERKQPYAAAEQINVDLTDPPAADKDIHHTFFGFNRTDGRVANPFLWPAHLDRKLISPAELFLTSAVKPHEFTQQFVAQVGATPRPHQHLADWRADDKRLFRALGLLTTPDWTEKLARLGRVPGKVNINTLTDKTVLQSIAAATAPGNRFTAVDVNSAYDLIAQQRDGNLAGQPSGTAQPFFPPGVAITGTPDNNFGPGTAQVSGLNRTLLDFNLPDPSASPAEKASKFFPVTYASGPPAETQHPALTNELLNKVYNRLTTRSNAFAVWFTIGYFEVRNNTELNADPTVRADPGARVFDRQRRALPLQILRLGGPYEHAAQPGRRLPPGVLPG